MSVLAQLILNGTLIPVQVFGGPDDYNEWGYGLCDAFSLHAPAGSDCNRAEIFLLRPSDDAMNSRDVMAALLYVLNHADMVDRDVEHDVFLGIYPNENVSPITDEEYKMILDARKRKVLEE